MDQHWTDPDQFVSASDVGVELWSSQRSSPVQTFTKLWGSDDTVSVVRYNPAESYLLGHCSQDRGVGLHDVRAGSALKKTILSLKANCFEWNPMEPMNFVVGSDDFNTYSFDMRKLDRPTMIHKGHTGPVLAVDWSPTGREFVTGSYDKTVRIFGNRSGTARDIYHTKRMQRVWTVNYTADNTYIVSGSDDSNLRLWKAQASQKLGQLTTREESALRYRTALVKRYEHMPEVKRISKARKVPKLIKKQTAIAHIQKESEARKQDNRAKNNTKAGTTAKFPGDRQKTVIKEID
jgi:WD repeat and SOF domain-containing protein 1